MADAVQALAELRSFLQTTTEVEFLADRQKQSFVFHRLVIVGEAAVNLRPAYASLYADVPWPQLVGLRNRLVHAYFDLNLPMLWNLASTGSVKLEVQFARILQTEFPGPHP